MVFQFTRVNIYVVKTLHPPNDQKIKLFLKNEKPFLQKSLKGTARFLKTGFFVAETRTAVENDGFHPIPVSTAFSFKTVKHGHVSGNIVGTLQ